jgi:hypothetical protein
MSFNIGIDSSKIIQLQHNSAKSERAAAFQAEADPLFFKVQRGEATQQEWLDKIEEIRARYPYPAE